MEIKYKFFTSYCNQPWQATKAKSIETARAVAMRRNPYVSTDGVCVGVEFVDNTGNTVIKKISSRRENTWIGGIR